MLNGKTNKIKDLSERMCFKMPEFSAAKARKLMDDSSEVNLLHWYTEFKYPIFKNILETATNGINSITVKIEVWGKSKNKKKYLLDRLNELGYEVYFSNNDEELVIKW
jgi:hypothetical protein